MLPTSVFAASSVPVTSSVNVSSGAASNLALSPSSTSALANHRTGTLTLSNSSGSAITATLSDNGVGGRFYSGTSMGTSSGSSLPISQITVPGSGNVSLFYCPPYNRATNVTVSASATGQTTVSSTCSITSYSTSTSYTPSQLQFDQVNTLRGPLPGFPFSNVVPSVFFNVINNLTGFTQISVSGGGSDNFNSGVYTRTSSSDHSVAYAYNTAIPTACFGSEIQVNSFGGGATDQVWVGFAHSNGDFIALVVDNHAGTAKVFQRVSGTFTAIPTPQSGFVATYSFSPNSFPSGTKFTLLEGYSDAGVALSAWFKRPTDTAYTSMCAGETADSTTFTVQTSQGLAAFFPFFGCSQSANTTAQLTNFRACQAGAYSLQQTSIVKDLQTNAPIMTPDGTGIYLNVPFGINTPAYGLGQMIAVLNIQTWTLTELSQINPVYTGSIGPTIQGHTANQSPNTTFEVEWDSTNNNWLILCGTFNLDAGNSNQGLIGGSSTAGVNILAQGALTTINVTDLTIPNNRVSGHYNGNGDINRISGTYTVVVNGPAVAAITAYTATSLTGTWTQQWTKTPTNYADGVTISQIGGTLYAFSNEGNGSSSNVQTWLFSNGTSNTSPSNITTNGLGSGFTEATAVDNVFWPVFTGVPGEDMTASGGVITSSKTRYIIPAWSSGLSSGELWIFEAVQRRTQAEFTWTTKS